MNNAFFNSPYGQYFDPNNCQLWTEGWSASGINNMPLPLNAMSLFDNPFPHNMDFIPFDDGSYYQDGFQQVPPLPAQPGQTQSFQPPAVNLLTNEPPDRPTCGTDRIQSGPQAHLSSATQSLMLSEAQTNSPKDVIKGTTDRAAYLRARIVASQKAKSATPELCSGGTKAANTQKSKLGAMATTKQEAASMAPPRSVPAMATASEPPVSKVHYHNEANINHVKSPPPPTEPKQPAPSVQSPKICDADIDALFSDVKASVETSNAISKDPDGHDNKNKDKDKEHEDKKPSFLTGGKPKVPTKPRLFDLNNVKTEAKDTKATIKVNNAAVLDKN